MVLFYILRTLAMFKRHQSQKHTNRSKHIKVGPRTQKQTREGIVEFGPFLLSFLDVCTSLISASLCPLPCDLLLLATAASTVRVFFLPVPSEFVCKDSVISLLCSNFSSLMKFRGCASHNRKHGFFPRLVRHITGGFVTAIIYMQLLMQTLEHKSAVGLPFLPEIFLCAWPGRVYENISQKRLILLAIGDGDACACLFSQTPFAQLFNCGNDMQCKIYFQTLLIHFDLHFQVCHCSILCSLRGKNEISFKEG